MFLNIILKYHISGMKTDLCALNRHVVVCDLQWMSLVQNYFIICHMVCKTFLLSTQTKSGVVSAFCGLSAADMSIPVGRIQINEVERLNRLTFGTVGGSSDQSLPALADLHLDSDDEPQDAGK